MSFPCLTFSSDFLWLKIQTPQDRMHYNEVKSAEFLNLTEMNLNNSDSALQLVK